MFMSEAIDYIIHFTNMQGRRMVAKWNYNHPDKRKTWNIVDRIEMEAFIGLLLLAGAYKAQYRPVSELWSLKEGQPVFRATVSEQRFKLIKGAMRFDDPARRDRSDRLAPVRFIFDLITEKFRSFVEASENLTIDEQLLEHHGQVDFRQYIGTKPGKFGIKIYWLTEAKSSYCLAGFVYIGADSIPEYITEESSSTTEATVWYLMHTLLAKEDSLLGIIGSQRCL